MSIKRYSDTTSSCSTVSSVTTNRTQQKIYVPPPLRDRRGLEIVQRDSIPENDNCAVSLKLHAVESCPFVVRKTNTTQTATVEDQGKGDEIITKPRRRYRPPPKKTAPPELRDSNLVIGDCIDPGDHVDSYRILPVGNNIIRDNEKASPSHEIKKDMLTVYPEGESVKSRTKQERKIDRKKKSPKKQEDLTKEDDAKQVKSKSLDNTGDVSEESGHMSPAELQGAAKMLHAISNSFQDKCSITTVEVDEDNWETEADCKIMNNCTAPANYSIQSHVPKQYGIGTGTIHIGTNNASSILLEDQSQPLTLSSRKDPPNLNYADYEHILELYDFPVDMKSSDLYVEFHDFLRSGFDLKWVDDTHCLAVFSSKENAIRALLDNTGLLTKVRRMSEACVASKWKLAKSPGDWMQPYKSRPQTSNLTARRLISHHLGLKNTISPTDRRHEENKLQNAKNRKDQRSKDDSIDAWNSKFS